jgi:hypothetical protein
MVQSKILLLILIFSSVYSSRLKASINLPYINLTGNIKQISTVKVKLLLIASNLDNHACYSLSYRFGSSQRNAHTYTLNFNGFSNFDGMYYVDMDTNNKFLSYLRKQVLNGKIDLTSGMSILDYNRTCAFKLKGLEFNANDTFLVLRHYPYIIFQSNFKLKEGSTESFTFDFLENSKLRLVISID